MKLNLLLKVAACAAVLTAGQAAPGATLTWNGPGGGGGPIDGFGNWDTNLMVTNWWNATTSLNTAWTNAIANVAVIGNNTGAAGTITVVTNILSAGLTFNPPGSGHYTLTGGIITNSGPVIFNTSATLNTPIINSGLVTLAAPVTISGTGAITNTGNLTLTANSSSTINNPIFTTAVQTWSGSNVSLTLTSPLTPSGAGNFVFSGSNAPYPYAPQFNISSFNGTGFTGGIYLSNGATLNINGGNWTNSGALVIRPTTIQQSAGGPNTVNDTLTLNITGGTTYCVGALTLGGSTSNSLGTNIINISGGTLNVAGNGSLVGQVNGQNYFIVSGNGTYIDSGTTSYFCIGNIGTGPGSTGFATYGGCVPVTTVLVTGNGTMIFSNANSVLATINNAGSGSCILMGREGNQASPSGSPGNPNGSLICQSTLRFDGGTFKTGRAVMPSGLFTTGSTNLVYFNGGLYEPILPCPNSNNMIQGLTGAYVSAGGANINNNGISWGMTQTLVTDPALTGTDGGLTLNGAGSMTLNGAPNTYTGPTVLGAGASLILNGTMTGAGAITIGSGASFLINVGGGWAGGGSLTVQNGGTYASFVPATAASLKFGSTSTDVTTNNFDVNLNPGTPYLLTAGAMTINGTNVINVIGPAPVAGTYTLIQYGNEVKGANSAFVLGSITYGAVGAYIQDTGSAIQLVVPTYVGETIEWTGTNTGNWTTSTNALDWLGLSSGNPAFYYNTAAVVFNSATTNANVNVLNSVLPLTVSFSGSDNYLLMGAGSIGDAAGLTTPVTINGPGYVTLGTSNTYTGGTTISGGALVLTNGGSIQQGTLASAGIQDNATLVFNRTDTTTFNNYITGSGQLVKMGSGTVTLNVTNALSGGVIVSNGTLALNTQGDTYGGPGTVNGTVTVMTNAVLQTTIADALGFTSSAVTTLNLYGGTLLNSSGAVNALWGNFGLTVNMYGGTIRTTTTNSYFSIGNTSVINTYSNANVSIIALTNSVNGLYLRQANNYFTVQRGTAPVDLLVNAPITQAAAGYGITVSGGGIMAVEGASTYTGGTTIANDGSTLQVGYAGGIGTLGAATSAVSDGGAIVFAMPGTNIIPNAISGGGGVTETGPGLTILSGASSFSGPTLITGGSLGFSGAGQNTGAGSIEVQSNATFVHLGSASSTYSTLKLDSGSSNAFTLPTAPDSISGAITVGSGNGPATILILVTGTTNGVYDLISYGGGLNGLGLAGLKLAFVNPSAGGTLTTNAAGNMLQLNLTNTGSLSWNGNIGASPTWDLLGSNQWTYTGTATGTSFANGDSVAFLDGATKYSVTISTNVLPASLTVQASNTYTFTGAGSIGGSTALSMNGPGLLTIGNSNTYTGGTAINGGTLQLTNAGFIAGPILDDSVFELSITNTNGVTYGNLITGTGSLLNHGPAIVTLTNNNTYTGNTTNSFGTLEFTSANPAPFGPGDIYLTDGTTGTGTASLLGVSVNTGTAARYTFTNNIWVPQNSGTAVFGATNSAALVYNSGIFYVGTLNLATNVTILTQNAEVYYDGTITGTGDITVNGTGRALLNVVANGGFVGDVYVTNAAGLQIVNADLGASRNVHLVSPASSIVLQGSVSVGQLTGTGTVTEYPSILSTSLISVGNGDASFTFSGAIQGGTWAAIPGCQVSTLGLQKTGAGVFTFAGYAAQGLGTEVAEGTMLVDGVINSSGMLVDAGATLGGIGTMTDPVIVNGILSPGPGPGVSVGALATGTETWNGGGSYMVGLSNATAAAGVDLLNITGALDIMSAPTNVFTIDLVTLTSSNTPGLMANFNKALNYSWPIATVSAGIVNFNTNNFILNTSGFVNDFSAAGTFSLDVIGNSLVVNYLSTALSAATITGGVISGGHFILSFTGLNTQNYTVLTSTNLTVPLPEWTVVATGTFGPGTSTYTNTTPNSQAQFYIVESP